MKSWRPAINNVYAYICFSWKWKKTQDLACVGHKKGCGGPHAPREQWVVHFWAIQLLNFKGTTDILMNNWRRLLFSRFKKSIKICYFYPNPRILIPNVKNVVNWISAGIRGRKISILNDIDISGFLAVVSKDARKHPSSPKEKKRN